MQTTIFMNFNFLNNFCDYNPNELAFDDIFEMYFELFDEIQ